MRQQMPRQMAPNVVNQGMIRPGQGSVSRPQQYQGETVQGVQFNIVFFSFYHTEGRGSAMER